MQYKTGYLIYIGGMDPIWKQTLQGAIARAEDDWCYRGITTVISVMTGRLVWGIGMNEGDRYETFHNEVKNNV